jgi:hypothetical protein
MCVIWSLGFKFALGTCKYLLGWLPWRHGLPPSLVALESGWCVVDVRVSGAACLAWGVCGTRGFPRISPTAIPLVHGPRWALATFETNVPTCMHIHIWVKDDGLRGGMPYLVVHFHGLSHGSSLRHFWLSSATPWPSRGPHRTSHDVHAWVRTWTSVGARETAPTLGGMLRAHLAPHLPQGKHAWAWVELDVQRT